MRQVCASSARARTASACERRQKWLTHRAFATLGISERTTSPRTVPNMLRFSPSPSSRKCALRSGNILGPPGPKSSVPSVCNFNMLVPEVWSELESEELNENAQFRKRDWSSAILKLCAICRRPFVLLDIQLYKFRTSASRSVFAFKLHSRCNLHFRVRSKMYSSNFQNAL